jgi:hypothetical protein
MQFSQIIEVVKIVLECLIVGLGWVFVRRLEQIKSEVARHSDFNQKWADLFFDASNAFMVSVERLMTCLVFIVNTKNPNDKQGMEWQLQLNATLSVFIENHYRIQRLAVFARKNGPAAVKAADDLFDRVSEFTATKKTNLDELRGKINIFNRAVREAHSEMIASREN